MHPPTPRIPVGCRHLGEEIALTLPVLSPSMSTADLHLVNIQVPQHSTAVSDGTDHASEPFQLRKGALIRLV